MRPVRAACPAPHSTLHAARPTLHAPRTSSRLHPLPFLALMACALSPLPALAQEKTTLTLLLDGKKAGTETIIRETPEKGTFRDTARVELTTPGGLTVTIDTVLVLQEREESLRPARYTLESKSGDRTVSVELTFEGPRARGTLRQDGQSRAVDLEPGTNFTLIENNVFHPYRSLYRRYNFDLGGVQKTPVLVPSAGAVLEATMERKGTARVKGEGKPETLERVAVTLGDMTFDLYGTRSGRFLFLVSEEQALRVATPGYESVALPAR
jgi:hypothetical protein